MSILATSLETWKTFKFLEFQRELDKTAIEIASRQDSADASRKRLVELSKEFRSSASDESRKSVAPLLKSFQTEVDSLSKRSKNAEAEYLTLYKKLIDLPDPTPALEKAVSQQKNLQKASDLEIENNQLRETLQEFKDEFAHIKNQEVTLKQLRERVRELEETMDENVANQLREKERELTVQFAERERVLNEYRLEAGRRICEMEQKVRSLQQTLTASQSELFETKNSFEELLNAKNGEMEILAADFEQITQQLNQTTEELLNTRNQMQQIMDGDYAEENPADFSEFSKQRGRIKKQLHEAEEKRQLAESRIWELELELSSREKEMSQLVDELRRAQTSMQHLHENNNAQVVHLEGEVNTLRQQCDQLRQQMHSQKDYNDLKREVEILRSVEFGEQSNQPDEYHPKSLDQLLAEKNRTLQNELTQSKVACENLTNRLQLRENEVVEFQFKLAKNQSLIDSLEEDLRQVRTLSSQLRGHAEGQDTSVSKMSLAENHRADSLSTGSMEAAQFSETQLLLQLVPQENDSIPKAQENPSNSLLTIVQSQRERFRARAQELESTNISQQQQIHFLQTEIDKIRADNVKLYEKVRYLQSYPGNKSSEEDKTVLDRYSGEYEERLNPFSTFSKKERQRKYENLRAHDKIALSMGRIIFNNPMARMFAFLYTIFLHLLVFMVLYKLAHTESCKRDIAEDCQRKFAEHMMKSHGNEH